MKKNDDKDKKLLEKWQGKLSAAKARYSAELAAMQRREDMYYGSHTIQGAKKKASNVRNVVYELIESEVDTSIPQPKVTAIHAEDVEKARKIENLLRNEIRRMPIPEMNDSSERTVTIQGGDFSMWNGTRLPGITALWAMWKLIYAIRDRSSRSRAYIGWKIWTMCFCR